MMSEFVPFFFYSFLLMHFSHTITCINCRGSSKHCITLCTNTNRSPHQLKQNKYKCNQGIALFSPLPDVHVAVGSKLGQHAHCCKHNNSSFTHSLASSHNTLEITSGDDGQHSADDARMLGAPISLQHSYNYYILLSACGRCGRQKTQRQRTQIDNHGVLRENDWQCCIHCNKMVLQSKHAGTYMYLLSSAICNLST